MEDVCHRGFPESPVHCRSVVGPGGGPFTLAKERAFPFHVVFKNKHKTEIPGTSTNPQEI